MKRRGFTLIELLVVIAIIAILAALIFPIFAKVKEKGRMTRCTANLKQLAGGVVMYCDDNNGRFPFAREFKKPNGSWQGDWSGSDGVGYWCYPAGDATHQKSSLFQYVKTIMVYRCPTDFNIPAPGISNPGSNDTRNYPLSYSMNTDFWNRRNQSATDGNSVLMSSIARTKEVMMLIHEARRSINDGDFNWIEGGLNDIPSDVHYTGTTLCYVDTHATYQTFQQLRKARNDGVWSVNARPTPPPNPL